MSGQLTDAIALKVEALWSAAFPGATLFPGIGLPSQDNGVLFLTHTLNLGKVMKINGLPSSSPLASNSLYSAEKINGKTFNIYEAQVPDIPGKNGNPSTAQIYVQALIAEGLTPAGSHEHWTGEYFFDGNVRDHNVPAIHHQQYDMDPIDFSKRTIRALLVAVNEIQRRVGNVKPDIIDKSTCCIDDRLAKKILTLWQTAFPDAFILPVVGFPSNNNNKVAIFTHTMAKSNIGARSSTSNNQDDSMLMKVNGLPSKSPLSNNALYSFECTRDKFLHFYEIMLPDIPGKNGERSTVQIYVNALRDNGLDVAGLHWHFWGGVADPQDRGVLAIHHQNVGMTPKQFTLATIRALNIAIDAINQRTGFNNMSQSSTSYNNMSQSNTSYNNMNQSNTISNQSNMMPKSSSKNNTKACKCHLCMDDECELSSF